MTERPVRTPRARARRTGGLAADYALVRRLLSYMRPYRRRLVAGLVTGAIYGVVSGAFPKAVESVAGRLFSEGPSTSLWTVVATGIAIPVYFALRGLMGFLNAYYLSWVGSRMLRDLRLELFSHFQELPLDFYVRFRVPQLIQRVNNNTATMQGSMVELAGDIVKQPITVVVAIGVLASIDPWFCLFALVLGAVCLIPMTLIGRKIRESSRQENESAGMLLGVLHESFSNVRVIKAYLLERIQARKFRDSADQQVSRSMRFQRQRELLSPVIEWIGSLGISAALVYVYFTGMPQDDFLAIMAGFFIMYEPLKRVGRMHLQIQKISAVSEVVFDLLDREQPRRDRPGAVDLDDFREEIRFDRVSLSYAAGKEALHEVSFAIPRGTVCALVGPSGAGKSSIANLLLRFYEPTSGTITIDGRDISDMTTHSVRDRIGVVTQETLLFADTVAENIGYGKPGATREDIVEAARKAHAHDFIEAMPRGYDTMLSERGQNLSGGQCQRLSIARAILKNPEILILDEATSSLDAESEMVVQKAMNELMRGRTVIVIAHRLASLRGADQLIVLDRGRIVEIGAHAELLGRDGLYRRLHDLQAL